LTLPRGFGRGWDEPIEPTKKCILGKSCDYGSRCKTHQWTWHHDEAWLGLRVIGIFTVIIGILILGVFSYSESLEPVKQIIDGFNCNQLAEYVADQSTDYGYAEHRYEWLCVNEQIKEFSG